MELYCGKYRSEEQEQSSQEQRRRRKRRHKRCSREQKRCNCSKPDVILRAGMEGEGPIEETIPLNLTLTEKTYDIHALCQNGIADLVTRTLKDNRKLIIKGKLNKATLFVSIQNGEETPAITTITDNNEKFVLALSLKKGDKISFGFTAGDNFSIDITALVKKKCDCRVY